MKVNFGHPEAATPDYDAVIRLNPNSVNAHANRGIANRKLGLTDDTKRDFQISLDSAEKVGDAELKSQIMKRLETL